MNKWIEKWGDNHQLVSEAGTVLADLFWERGAWHVQTLRTDPRMLTGEYESLTLAKQVAEDLVGRY